MNMHTCKFCNAPLACSFIDLGTMPLANAYLPAEKVDLLEPAYPLRAFTCTECWLVQADSFVPPEDIFSDYAYFSSYSKSWVEHARRFTIMARQRFGLNERSQVIEIASNDGYLLGHFIEAGVPVLGIEPATNIAEVARAAGVPTETRFFGLETAEDLVARDLSADLVVGNNVFAHAPNINDFVAGLATVLKPDGVISLEFPHLLQLIDNVQFDTVYHEHFYYFSLLAVEKVFAKYKLKVLDVEELPTHGGSLRVIACRQESNAHATGPGLVKVRADEAAACFDKPETYEAFQSKVNPVRDGLLAFLRKAKSEGKTVVAYGAAAKGNTLLNFCGIGRNLIDYVVDLNPHKQNHFMPGSKLAIHAPDRMATTRPDYVLILPWNIQKEIVSSNDIASWGGRFAVAVPELSVLE